MPLTRMPLTRMPLNRMPLNRMPFGCVLALAIGLPPPRLRKPAVSKLSSAQETLIFVLGFVMVRDACAAAVPQVTR
jgi:hypothetical protein